MPPLKRFSMEAWTFIRNYSTLKCGVYIEASGLVNSGDCSNVSNVINEYEIDEFYQDTCLPDYEGSTHASLRLLCQTIPEDKRYKVFCMHIDCDELIKKAKDAGFNVAEIKSD